MLDGGAPQALGLPLLGVGSVALAASLFAGGRRAVRTRYRPDPWRLAESVVGLSGLAALAGMIVAARLPGGGLALDPPAYPLTWPTLPLRRGGRDPRRPAALGGRAPPAGLRRPAAPAPTGPVELVEPTPVEVAV